MKRLIPLVLALSCGLSTPAVAGPTARTLANESGRLAFTWKVEGGNLSYAVLCRAGGDSREVVGSSPLGLVRSDAGFSSGLEFVSASPLRKVEESYQLAAGKRRAVRHEALEQTFAFRNAGGGEMHLVVRAMADGVAFRYAFPAGPTGRLLLTGEATGFRIPLGGVAWMLPYDRIAEWSPSYEMPWQNRIPIGTTVDSSHAGWAFPALFQLGAEWVMITEAGMDGTCYAAHLEAEAPDGLYRIRLPEDDETYGVAAKEAEISLPWRSPWRVILVGDTPGTMVESTAVTDLSAPCELDDVSWIRPGRVSWSWWSDKGSPADYHRLVPFIDLAADFGWEYSLIDLGWESMTNGSIEQLAGYARRKNVGLILWYNSGGPHNRVYAGLRDRMHLPEARETEMAWLARLGIKGIKVDFMQSDKQHVMQLYIDILRAAARHHLLVDFHGATVPRGWARTFPNLLTQEGVRGAEQYWDPLFAEHAHTYHTIYPFTRNAIGSMDYTPVIFGAAPELQWHKTTNAHELALSIAFESGLQHFVDSVSAYRSQPDEVRQLLRDVPADWDETRHVAGTPGDLSVIARRKGIAWFLSALNGRDVARTETISLSFLGGGSFRGIVIGDGTWQKDYKFTPLTVTAADKLVLELAPRGGCAARMEPAGPLQ